MIKIGLFELFVILTKFPFSKCAVTINDRCLSCMLPFTNCVHTFKYVDNLLYDAIAAPWTPPRNVATALILLTL